MKKYFSFLFSTQFMTVLILLFCIGMGVATFVENDFGTPAARKLVFDATWFEIVIVLLAMNFIGNIKKYKLWKRTSWPVLTFHIALVTIIIGAAISRLIAFEGIMHIREGSQSNVIVSDKTYLQVSTKNGESFEKELLLTPITNNNFSWKLQADNKEVTINYVSYIPHAIEVYEKSDRGEAVIHLVASANTSGRTDFYIPKGKITNIFGTSISYGLPGMGDIQIIEDNGNLKIKPHHDITFMKMADQSRGIAKQDSLNPFHSAALYIHDGMSFVLKNAFDKAIYKIVPSEREEDKSKEDVLVVNVTSGSENSDVVLSGMKGILGSPKQVVLNDINLSMQYGSKTITTPFSIHLNDFQLQRYPGSQSPASFASEVKVIDENNSFPFRIYMNNVLDYRGYRFFQASYDSDELGTVLSVNHDFLGTVVTYLGYALMMLGMLMTLFWKGTRFSQLTKILANNKAVLIIIGICCFVVPLNAQQHTGISLHKIDSLFEQRRIDLQHANEFGGLLVQDEGGRVKPINTVASEVLRKLYKKTHFKGLNANQVFLSMHADPMLWSFMPIIRITKGKHTLEQFSTLKGKHARYVDFFDNEGNYLLADATEKVVQKREAERNDADKLLLEVSQRVTLMYELFNGKLLRLFPLPNDPNQKWYSYTDLGVGFTGEDSTFVYNIPYIYFRDVKKAIASNDWSEATEKLTYFDKYQQHYGKEIMPSESKVKLEMAYNEYEVFNKLYKYYGLVGFLMLVVLIINIFKQKSWLHKLSVFGAGAILLMFIAHTLGLGVRWYISGHAPWSNAYESMVYVAWSTVLVGLLFIRRSKITLSATAIMASIFLMVAHWSWMDPEINNLVPVLNSYWLMIHVAIIVASYGPFTLAFLLGIISLILFTMQTKANQRIVKKHIDRLTQINEVTITIGVFLLAAGTFLGGVWANESWGRYWSWDPKETWALISIMIYAFVLHMRLIPGLKGNYTFNLAAILSYSSIMMTYFGVNYYLAGMHSYAKGDPVPVPDFVYYTVGSIVVLAIIAYWRKIMSVSVKTAQLQN
ncbi:c-type cytochrome biogenesis protein CcsB [Fulvivirgaceae bacterium BMA10]|uniref:C-type cytochrome biogenesis protein CcsB n=1 Tax=Splendidivirga corallicola TaxID=3051826 RepID=A0ABT8KXL8_9BACT|nr:c-type cytochrome biogenesis protein CcsB [Fulvivirgaceae bacterium BMA10]